MDLNKKFKITCNKFKEVSSISDNKKLIFKVGGEPDYIVNYDDNYKIINIISDNLEWKDQELEDKDKFGILQKFKNYDPRYIINNFQKISENQYKQNLKTPFPGFTSHQLYTFDFDNLKYIKQSFLNDKELTEQKYEFILTYL
jgi:hypothetical protein